MIWNICLALSIASIFITAVILLILRKRRKKKYFISLNALLVGVIIAVFFTYIPVYHETFRGDSAVWLKTVLMSLNRTFRAFGFTDIDFLHGAVGPDQGILGFYSAYMTLLCFICPLFTVGYILSFFRKARASISYFLSYFKDIYVFSSLNKNSIALAKDIYDHHPQVAVVFTGVNEAHRNANPYLIRAAGDINAICFTKDILSIDFNRHSKKRSIIIFAIENDEQENTTDAVNLISKYKERKNTELYVFSSALENKIMMTDIDKGYIKVRRRDLVSTVINSFLYQRGDILFKRAVQKGHERLIGAVIVGLDEYGKEMLKTLAWYCQMDGYRLVIDAYDTDPMSESVLREECPELLEEKNNTLDDGGEADYRIRVHHVRDYRSADLAQELTSKSDTSYAFVSMGSDSKNIETAAELRKLYERAGMKPYIQTIVFETEKAKAMNVAKTFRSESYNIDCIGDRESVFSEEQIIHSQLEAEALEFHLRWGDEEAFWNYEFNYSASVASVIHSKARVACNIPGADKKQSQLTKSEKHAVSLLEHRRWNTYMRSRGYVYSGSTKVSGKSELAKTHNDLIDYYALSDEEQAKDDNWIKRD